MSQYAALTCEGEFHNMGPPKSVADASGGDWFADARAVVTFQLNGGARKRREHARNIVFLEKQYDRLIWALADTQKQLTKLRWSN